MVAKFLSNVAIASPCFIYLSLAGGWWLVAGGCLKEVSSINIKIKTQTLKQI